MKLHGRTGDDGATHDPTSGRVRDEVAHRTQPTRPVTSCPAAALAQQYQPAVQAKRPDRKDVPARAASTHRGRAQAGHSLRLYTGQAQDIEEPSTPSQSMPTTGSRWSAHHADVLLQFLQLSSQSAPQGLLPLAVPVVGICDHAVAVEHPADVLLGPVPAGLLRPHQEHRRPARMWQQPMLRLSLTKPQPGFYQM